ncbi:unnamed protein product [Parajaminaea phylloscopi]
MGITDFFSSNKSNSPSPAPVADPKNTSSKHVTALNPQGIKPCCACPETKIRRDECFLQYGHAEGEEGVTKCKQLVEEHRRCMKQLGFNI